MCNHSQRDVLNAVLKVVYALISFEVFIKLASYFSIKNLIFSTLYINYEDGFIRRGFFGAILFWFSKITNINPFYFQISLTIIVLLALIIWILRKFLNQKLNFYIFIGSFMLANVLAYNMFFFVEVYMILLSIILFTVLKQIEKPIYIKKDWYQPYWYYASGTAVSDPNKMYCNTDDNINCAFTSINTF